MGWFQDAFDTVKRTTQEVVSVAANPVDSVFLLKGKITGEADRWVSSNSRDEPPMAQDVYPHRKHQNSNVIPSGPSNIHSDSRKAYIACRVVMGGALDGFVAREWKSSVLSYSTAPNPDHHWAVVVGGYYHQLQATNMANGDNYYTNEPYDLERGGWRQFEITSTNYNDVAVRNAAVEVMNNMPETYNVANNNCQTFALRLLDRIGNGRKVQQQLNGTFGIMAQPKLELKPTLVYRINEDGTETPVSLEPVNVEEKKEPVVDVSEIRCGDDDEELEFSNKAKERLTPLVDALKIMSAETPVIELRNEA